MKNLIIKLEQLKEFLAGIKKWVADYFDSRIWTGTRAEYEAAIAAGTIKDGTIINITDDYEAWEECTSEDIENLFK